MWITDFCARHSSHCVQTAEECTDAERRLVSRFRSSPEFAAHSDANFGIEGH